MISPSFWQNKNILLTGHTGFKGSWLSLWLLHMGARVTGIALKPDTEPSLFNELKLDQEMESFLFDIRDEKNVLRKVQATNPDIVIHMAAQPLVRDSYNDPLKTYSTNVMGTANLLEACRHTESIRQIINVTTDKVYENKELDIPFKESDRLGGFDPYSNSKACSELVTSSYRNSFFAKDKVKIVTARAGNVIGGGDWAVDRLIPDIIRAYQSKEKLIIRNPKAIRPWQHVLESLAGYLCLAEHLDQTENYIQEWNFGPGAQDFMNVAEIVQHAQKKMALEVELEQPNLHEAQILKLDNSLAKKHLSWSSQWKASEAIDRTLSWYQCFLEGENAKELCLKDIKEFTL